MTGLITRYYAIYILLLALFAGIHFFMPQFEIGTDAAYATSIICIVFLFTIPVSLKLFSVKTKGNKKLKTKEEKQANYIIWARNQMYLVALPAVVSAIAYGFLRDRSTMFCYLIAFFALIMCKPSVGKMEECCRDEEF